VHAPLAKNLPGLRKYIQNHLRPIRRALLLAGMIESV